MATGQHRWRETFFCCDGLYLLMHLMLCGWAKHKNISSLSWHIIKSMADMAGCPHFADRKFPMRYWIDQKYRQACLNMQRKLAKPIQMSTRPKGRGLTGALESDSPAHWITDSPAHRIQTHTHRIQTHLRTGQLAREKPTFRFIN